MSSESKTAPVIVSVIVLAAAIFFLGKSLIRAPEDTPAPQVNLGPTAPVEPVPLHPRVEEGVEALRKLELERARDSFEQVPNDHPSYLIALAHLGALYERLGDLEASRRAIDRIESLQTEDPRTYLTLSREHLYLGNHASAEMAALRALELLPDNVPLRYNLGLIRVAQGKVAHAVNAYRRAMEADRQAVHITQSMLDLQRLHEDRPELPDVHYALAFLFNARGWQDQEREELEHYVGLAPGGPASSNARSRLEVLGPAPAPGTEPTAPSD